VEEKGHIRKAVPGDLEAVNRLLGQVLAVHHRGRPDLFNATGKKYTDSELLAIFDDLQTPVFVYEEGGVVLGYAFCALRHQGSGSLMPLTTLYIDDLCVDEAERGHSMKPIRYETHSFTHRCSGAVGALRSPEQSP
jgi:hypothetical protein